MPELRLTQRALQTIETPPAGPDGQTRQVFYRDATLPGFGVRVTSGGSRAFVFERRVPGRTSPRRITLGRVGALTLEQARHKAMTLLSEVADGLDPVQAKQARDAQALTLGGVLPRNRGYLHHC